MHFVAVLDMSLLESPNSLSPAESKGKLDQGKIQKDLNPIAEKGRMIPRLGTRQMCPQVKSQSAQVKKQLKKGRWQRSVTIGKNKQPTTKTENN